MTSVCESCLGEREHHGGYALGAPGSICEVCGRVVQDAEKRRRDESALLLPPRPSRGRAFWDKLRGKHPNIPPHRFVEDRRRLRSNRMRPEFPPDALRAIRPRFDGNLLEVDLDHESVRPLATEVTYPDLRIREKRTHHHWVGPLLGLIAAAAAIFLVSTSVLAPDSSDTPSEPRPADWSGSPAAQVPHDPQAPAFEESTEGPTQTPRVETPATCEALEESPEWTEVAPPVTPPLDEETSDADGGACVNASSY